MVALKFLESTQPTRPARADHDLVLPDVREPAHASAGRSTAAYVIAARLAHDGRADPDRPPRRVPAVSHDRRARAVGCCCTRCRSWSRCSCCSRACRVRCGRSPAARAAAPPGLNDTMSPGDITNLGALGRDRVSRRVRRPAAARQRPVLARPVADATSTAGPGRCCQGTRRGERVADTIEYRGEPTSYRVMLEPNGRNWAFALDMPRTLDRRQLAAHGQRLPARNVLRRPARARGSTTASRRTSTTARASR